MVATRSFSSAAVVGLFVALLVRPLAATRVASGHLRLSAGARSRRLALEGTAGAEGTPIEDFPKEPPIALSPVGASATGARLGNGPTTTATEGLRVHRDYSLSGRDMTISAPNGTILYTAKGDYFTFTSRTHFFEGEGAKEIALVTKTFWSWHNIYEVHSYEPVCPGQQPEADTGTDGRKIYQFARLTEYFFSLWDRWSLERYSCDGTLTELWDLNSRHSFLYEQFELREQGHIVGAIDQAYFFQWTPNYNAFVAANEDRHLFAVTATLVDMAQGHKASQKSSSRHDQWDGYGGGNHHGGHAGRWGDLLNVLGGIFGGGGGAAPVRR